MTRTPASLLDRLRQPSNSEAWGRFVALYTPLIYSWARGVGLQEQDAADLVQEVFVTLMHVLPEFTYHPEQSFRGWLRTVTLNKWRNLCKKRNHHPRLEDENHLNDASGRNELEALWDAEFDRHLAASALRVMQADFQVATWKACWDVVVVGRSATDVAAELGMSVGAVYAAKFRVLERLRRELAGMMD